VVKFVELHLLVPDSLYGAWYWDISTFTHLYTVWQTPVTWTYLRESRPHIQILSTSCQLEEMPRRSKPRLEASGPVITYILLSVPAKTLNWLQSRTNKDDKSNQSFRVPPKTIGIDADSKELSVDQVWAKSIEPFLGKCQISKFDPQNIGQTVKKLAKILEKCAIDSFW